MSRDLDELKGMIPAYNATPHHYAHYYPRKHIVSISGSPYTEQEALEMLRRFFYAEA